MKGVLFLCTGNSCRSQMAEGFARRLAPRGAAIFSAGIEPAGLHPRAVQVMAEIGVDISNQRSKDLREIALDSVDTVVTLCGDAAERCPAFAADVARLHWGLPDPARARGSEREIQRAFREVRDEIDARVRSLFAAARSHSLSRSAS